MRRLFESLNYAVEGFIYVVKTQRNMRLHFLVATLVLVLGIYLNLPKMELLLLTVAIALVLISEMINTAIELTIDLIKNAYHPLARLIKDIMAGAVFLSAICSTVVGYAIFSQRIIASLESGIKIALHSSWQLTFIALIFVGFFVVFGKIVFHRGTPFRGGMPSGHAAFAFSMWTAIAFSTQNGVIIFLSFILAFLVARHRLIDNIHTLWEVIAGAILGVLVTALVFQLVM